MVRNQTWEVWVDNVKVLACILVVLGHFFQSMTKSNIIQESDLYLWFNQTIYYFHVPLFFICSGYLYQKYSRVNSLKSWSINVKKKALALGIPYVTFSIITWLLKIMFSSSVNNKIGGFFYTIFIVPASPYWYLYCLFFLFFITPTLANKKMGVVVFLIAFIFKIMNIWVGSNIYLVSSVFSNNIWFVSGMCLCLIDFTSLIYKKMKYLKYIGIGLGIAFLVASVQVYKAGITFEGVRFLLGVTACTVIVLIFANIFKDNIQNKFFGFVANYTLPIFVMHTIFAAFLRILLLKIGVTIVEVHILFGLIISFLGPIIAAMFMEHFKWVSILLYPRKFINIKTLN